MTFQTPAVLPLFRIKSCADDREYFLQGEAGVDTFGEFLAVVGFCRGNKSEKYGIIIPVARSTVHCNKKRDREIKDSGTVACQSGNKNTANSPVYNCLPFIYDVSVLSIKVTYILYISDTFNPTLLPTKKVLAYIPADRKI